MCKQTALALLTRLISTPHGTPGILKVHRGSKVEHLVTLEPPWVNNARFLSCIPYGTYKTSRVENTDYPQWRVHAVPGRTDILIHALNLAGDPRLKHASETEGCIGLGCRFFNINGQLAIADSRVAHERLGALVGNSKLVLKIEWAVSPSPNYI